MTLRRDVVSRCATKKEVIETTLQRPFDVDRRLVGLDTCRVEIEFIFIAFQSLLTEMEFV